MKMKPIEMPVSAADALPMNENAGPSALFTRREMLGMTSMAGMAALTGMVPEAVAQAVPRRPRIAVCASYWGLPTSHADWIVNKLLDGYWWQGAHTPSSVDVVSVYVHQYDTSLLAQRICKAKGIPMFKSVGEAVMLGGKELAVDGVVIVCEHGNYPTDLKGHWLLPRWWIYNQVMQVFQRSGRSVPVFNDKHLSYNWDDAKWMFDKSRELGFALSGGSSVPVFFRKPETYIAADTPIQHTIVVGDSPDEGAIFHCIDLLQSVHDRRRGGETGVKSVQSIRGPEAWTWVERTAWASSLLEAVRKNLELPPGAFQQSRNPNICIVEYNDGTSAAVIPPDRGGYGWAFAAEIEGKQEPTVVSIGRGDFPGPIGQYHASNGYVHWITEMMVTGKEQFHAERLLVSTGITNNYMESNWQDGVYSPVGRVVPTPYLNMKYRSTHGRMFETGPHPPNKPYIRGFAFVND